MTEIQENSWQATVLTLFPDMFPGPLGYSLAGKALNDGIWALETVDIRAFASDKHRSVDDTPAGGGPGMILRADVLGAAIDSVQHAARLSDPVDRPVIYLSPRGRPLRQQRVRELTAGPGAILICGRFEGVDQRILDVRNIEEVSLGDYILSGGEPAAIALLDAVVRLLPGVVGDPAVLSEESFEQGLLEYPHYTRPAEWEGHKIPQVLLSGNHAAIRQWRRQQAEKLTQQRRPDLWRRYEEMQRNAAAVPECDDEEIER
ncbi:MAG TPA: tRNA (guanosine(37)-N1)-methyltransferase TrmD [Alphaproteobacteria bacterium]|jgi:tRNA (guanine37-N1)-methyltransferase|nr:tRNA (guanosine(37)-N1)-methyltransferase TrmD [Alphaproteobacteria bacterium]HAM46358.1 tRNA (guanosine(37)-N1)-methyltransferase TrmD [Alphaproteobacteria bacterium]HBA43667.1 tRNA (guanosine(37)-N1)-methyltransferase TrmD [Alphaproteobacteria bacterium]HBC54560.1 tRNA (guanosine(37)-N1)-methyltransferase TrmD [Alphaproteobacteria bacterium]